MLQKEDESLRESVNHITKRQDGGTKENDRTIGSHIEGPKRNSKTIAEKDGRNSITAERKHEALTAQQEKRTDEVAS